MKKLNVLVTGATGKQGGAVARQLLERGHRVRGLSRKPASPAATALGALGVDVVGGDMEDQAALDRALDGVDAMFAMSTPFQAGTAAETHQGVDAADAAKAAGVHLVYSSVANADKETGIPHFESKMAVERHIRSIGVEATILAPVYFMENLQYVRAQLKDGVYASALSPARKLAQVAVSDIAAVAVAVLEDRDRYAGKRFDLAGDELTGAETADILSRVTGRRLSYHQIPMEVVRRTMGEDGALMNEWFERVGYSFDGAALRREFPDVPWLSFEAWARSQDWERFFGA